MSSIAEEQELLDDDSESISVISKAPAVDLEAKRHIEERIAKVEKAVHIEKQEITEQIREQLQ